LSSPLPPPNSAAIIAQGGVLRKSADHRAFGEWILSEICYTLDLLLDKSFKMMYDVVANAG
jgi:hypothetical protein